MLTFLEYADEREQRRPLHLHESIGPTGVRAGALVLLSRISHLSGETQADKAASAAQKRLASQLTSLAGLVSIGIYAMTGDPNPAAVARRFGGTER